MKGGPLDRGSPKNPARYAPPPAPVELNDFLLFGEVEGLENPYCHGCIHAVFGRKWKFMKLLCSLILFVIAAALLDWNWYRQSTVGTERTCIPAHIHHPGYIEHRETEAGIPYDVYFPPYDTPAPGCQPIPF